MSGKSSCVWLLFWILNTGYSQDLKPSIVYIFDPLCSWCYTFNPVLEKLQSTYKDKINFTVIAGGMITGPKGIKISEIAEYVLDRYREMENLSGVKTGESYLNLVKDGAAVLHSDKPCQSVVAFRSIKPDEALNFSHDLQKMFFLKGFNLNEDSTYETLAANYQIDKKVFLNILASDSVKTETIKDYRKAEEAGISGFPALIMHKKGRVILISEGFSKPEKLERKINKILK